MRKFFIAAAAITLMMTVTVLTSCTDDNDNPVPVVVTDDKPFNYDQYIDTSVRPGDDFFRYQYGKWLADNQQPSLALTVVQKLNDTEQEVVANSNLQGETATAYQTLGRFRAVSRTTCRWREDTTREYDRLWWRDTSS